MNRTKKPSLLIILDGYGYRESSEYNAVAHAQTPHLDFLFSHYPHTLLRASGAAVGLPKGYIGNSEVGHLTIGAGRIIKQPITMLLDAIADGSFFSNTILTRTLKKCAEKNTYLHLFGLLSDAGVHSHIKILYALLDAAVQHGVTKIAVHPFLDGRDTPPQSAPTYLQELDDYLHKLGHGSIASIHGRFYAMDRDKNWERTQESYAILTKKEPASEQFPSWHDALAYYYQQGITDEFIPPTQLAPAHCIAENDGCIFFNTRADRARQLTQTLTDPDFNAFPTKQLDLGFYLTPIAYDHHDAITVLYEQPSVHNTLKQVLSDHDKTIFSIAETEKYAHVTYFFSGGQEAAFPTENRILIPSIAAKNYIATPAMSANAITHAVLDSLATEPHDFYLINYANADMVGHSGDFDATVKAVTCLDQEIKKIYERVINDLDGTIYLTADHGNAEMMVDPETGQPHTAHTTNPVPFAMIKKDLTAHSLHLPLTQLADIAPWILKQMMIPLPPEMHHSW